jgi:CHASE3 domain sensor protein
MKVGAISNWTVRFSFGSAIAILVLVGAFAYRSVTISGESEGWLQHTNEVLNDLQILTTGMAEISSSIRRFVITGEDSDLEPYRVAKLKVERLQPILRDMTLDNPEQQRRLPVLEKLAAGISVGPSRRPLRAKAITVDVSHKGRMDRIADQLADG